MTSIRRTELYRRVWATPMNRLAAELGVSSIRLAEDCRRHAIPAPRAGHWSKIAHGVAAPQPALPEGDDVSIDFTVARPKRPARSAGRAAETRRVASPISRPDSPQPPMPSAPALEAHPLTSKTIARLLALSGSGLRHAAGEGCFRVSCSPGGIARAEGFLTLLAAGAEASGIELVDLDRRGLVFKLQGETLAFELVEQTDRSAHRLTEDELSRRAVYLARVAASKRTGAYVSPYDAPKFPDWDYKPNGKFSFKFEDKAGYLGVRKTFSDRKSQPVEDLVPIVLETMHAYLAAVEARKAERERQRMAAEAAETERRRLQAREELEERRAEFLDRQIERLQAADRIDVLLRHLGDAVQDEGVRAFATWASGRRDRLRAAVTPEELAGKLRATDLMNDEAVIPSWIDVETGKYGR